MGKATKIGTLRNRTDRRIQAFVQLSYNRGYAEGMSSMLYDVKHLSYYLSDRDFRRQGGKEGGWQQIKINRLSIGPCHLM
ncbi:hypothetical protein L249_8080 [Ophiocordyceps polyrhachis-furcata BCC 54312]|uniref:Uncharacterized protein n=1 Tax=Ophiocordyceps polyrhachis-furcata BCC 54312 TaxID=1330021 RepID=A0A367LH44_9HYPO|nr:hypothetical protein L249_8080 [Ophiocordyceps polyrhachis-furcata BCC 54312]